MAYRNATHGVDALRFLIRAIDRQIIELTAALDFESARRAERQRRLNTALTWFGATIVLAAAVVPVFGWNAWVTFAAVPITYAATWAFGCHRDAQRSEGYLRAFRIALAMTQRHHQDAKSMLRDLDHESECGRTEGHQ